jgi:hypothetical protein
LHVNTGWLWVELFLVGLVATSCVSSQAKYLKEVRNRATTAEVEQHLGRPHSAWQLRTGETLWTYQAGMPSGMRTGGVTIVGPGWEIGRRVDCAEYVLLFDQQTILRAWRQQPCSPDRPVSHAPIGQQASVRLPH